MGVGDAVLTDRTEEHPCELAEFSAADNQHGRVFQCLAEDRTRISSTTRLVIDRPGHSDSISINVFSRTCLASRSGSSPARTGVYQPGLLYQSQATTTSIFSPVKDA